MEALNSGSSLVLGSTLVALGGAYINAKLGISNDLRALHNERTFSKRLQLRFKELSPVTTHYGMLQHAVDVRGLGDAEALWFEQKTWTYAQLKDCECEPSFLFPNMAHENTDLFQWLTILPLFSTREVFEQATMSPCSLPIHRKW
jgi:hypothetical protein